MGADLLYSFNEIQATKEQALTNVDRLVNTKALSDIAKELENDCGISTWFSDPDEQATTAVTAADMTTAVSSLVGTASAEQIPSTCSAIGLLLKTGLNRTSVFLDSAM